MKMSRELPFQGHEDNFKRLLDLYIQGRLPHALLLSGPEGIGKGRVAKQMAKAILCQEKDLPCGKCGSCRLFAEEKHPDFLPVLPENRRIKIDAIREITGNFAFAPLMSSRRVIYIPEAHLMNPAAGNALLKTLEEPPPDTFFLLVTHAAGWIPRTIISRCQTIRLNPLPDETLRSILTDAGVSADQALLDDAHGSAGAAMRMANSLAELPAPKDCVDLSGQLSSERAYHYAQQVVDADALEPFLEALLGEARRGLVSQQPGSEINFDLLCFTDKILEMRRRLKVNINPKMALMRLLLFFREPLTSRLES